MLKSKSKNTTKKTQHVDDDDKAGWLQMRTGCNNMEQHFMTKMLWPNNVPFIYFGNAELLTEHGNYVNEKSKFTITQRKKREKKHNQAFHLLSQKGSNRCLCIIELNVKRLFVDNDNDDERWALSKCDEKMLSKHNRNTHTKSKHFMKKKIQRGLKML